jgi:hypothetical protein
MSRVDSFFMPNYLYKSLVFLKILIEKKFEHKLFGSYTRLKYNAYNPLTYIYRIILFLSLLFINIFLDFKSFIVNFKDGFKYN